MAVKSKPKVDRRRYFVIILVAAIFSTAILYLGVKMSQLLRKNNSWINPAWLDYFPVFCDYLRSDHQSGTLSVFQKNFYIQLWSSVYDDLHLLFLLICNFVVYLTEVLSSILALISLVVLICVCLTVSLYKDTRDKKGRKQKDSKKTNNKRNGRSAKNDHVCCEHQEDVSTLQS